MLAARYSALLPAALPGQNCYFQVHNVLLILEALLQKHFDLHSMIAQIRNLQS